MLVDLTPRGAAAQAAATEPPDLTVGRLWVRGGAGRQMRAGHLQGTPRFWIENRVCDY
jgi:hypothetical protein